MRYMINRDILSGVEDQYIFFRLWVNYIKNFLINKCGENATNKIIKDSKKKFKEIFKRIPKINEDNPLLDEYLFYIRWIVLWKTMKNSGISVEVIGELIYDEAKINMENLSQKEKLDVKNKWFTKWRLIHKEYALESQKKEFEYNWVYEYKEGDKVNFDFGLKFNECAVEKIFKYENVLELLPYVCSIDYLWSDEMGLGVKRDKCIKDGDDFCLLCWRK